MSSLRKEEYFTVLLASADKKLEFVASYSTKIYTQYESVMNILRTTFVCVVLAVASLFFNKGAQELVLNPLERMIEKVKIIAKNPQIAATDEIDKIGFHSGLEHNT